MRKNNEIFINEDFKPKVLKRKHIEKQLEKIFSTNLFVVSASMGYGKTTAVYEFLHNKSNYNIMWFSASACDNDEEWLWKKFCRVIGKLNPKMEQDFKNIGLPYNVDDIENIIDLLRTNINEETVIVIDDGECIKSKKIKKIFDIVAFDMIPKLHIVFITQNAPSYEYVRSEAKKQCVILWQEDFVFSKEETKELFKINNIVLNERELEHIYNYTLGWIMPTYVILVDWNKNRSVFNSSKCVKLIKESIFNEFTSEEKLDLIKLGVLSDFSIKQAIYITEDKNIERLIKSMYDNNLLVQYDALLNVYKFHSIFKILLNDEILNADILKSDIHNKAADYYLKNNRVICAFQEWQKAENYDRIFDYIERNGSYTLMKQAPKVIMSIFDNINLEQKEKYVQAYLMYINFIVFSKQKKFTREDLKDVMKIYKDSKNEFEYKRILGELYIIAAQLGDSSIINKMEFIEKAFDLLKGTKSRIIHNDSPFTLGSYNILYSVHGKPDYLKEAVERFRDKVIQFMDIGNGYGSGAEYLIMAEYEYEVGNVQNAESFVYKALYKAKNENQESIIISAYFLICRILLNTSKLEKFKENLKVLAEYYIEDRKLLRCSKEAAAGYIYGILGKNEKIPSWIKQETIESFNSSTNESKNSYIPIGISMLNDGKFVNLEILTETMLKQFTNSGNVFGMIYTYIFNSVVKYKHNNIETSKEMLMQAVHIAEKDMIIMPFIEMAPHIIQTAALLKEECGFLNRVC